MIAINCNCLEIQTEIYSAAHGRTILQRAFVELGLPVNSPQRQLLTLDWLLLYSRYLLSNFIFLTPL